jgi:hypothetical protein
MQMLGIRRDGWGAFICELTYLFGVLSLPSGDGRQCISLIRIVFLVDHVACHVVVWSRYTTQSEFDSDISHDISLPAPVR